MIGRDAEPLHPAAELAPDDPAPSNFAGHHEQASFI